ncbi:hypothetical protein B4907_03375 [Yersinia kristensenii]|nr:hypothetical protein B4907_03375 [Yersinia kristensenii]
MHVLQLPIASFFILSHYSSFWVNCLVDLTVFRLLLPLEAFQFLISHLGCNPVQLIISILL